MLSFLQVYLALECSSNEIAFLISALMRERLLDPYVVIGFEMSDSVSD
jgi:hypothetical protein